VHVRRIFISVAALALPVTVLSTVVNTGGAQALTVGTGTVHCNLITGAVSFQPALKHFVANATAERVTFKLKATGCTTSGSNIPVVNSGVISGVFNTVDTSCLRVTPFNTTPPVTLGVNWSPATTAPSQVTFSNDRPFNSAGPLRRAFNFPSPGPNPPAGNAAVTPGTSFPGGNGGLTSTMFIKSNRTPAQVTAACNGVGLPSLKIYLGNITLQ